MQFIELTDYTLLYVDKEIMGVLGQAMFMPTAGRMKSAAEAIYSKQQGSFYLCKDGDTLLGVIGLQRTDNIQVEIMHIAVAKDHQGKGVGRFMIEEAFRYSGTDTIVAETDSDAVDFYKKCGFKVKLQKDNILDTDRYWCVKEA